MTLTGRQILAGVVSLVVLAAIVTGIVILGSPSEERARRLDQLRVNDLGGIKNAVNFYYDRNGRLPSSLDELSKEPGVHISTDPISGQAYRYRSLGADEFELCGTFDRDSERPVSSGVDIWAHRAGDHCVTLTVDRRRPQ